MSRGDVCWLELPDEGRRPVCVITRVAAIPVLRNVTVALVTRTIRGIPTELRLGPGDGLSKDCAITLDNLRTVPRALLSAPITTLSGTRMHELCRALNVATGCT